MKKSLIIPLISISTLIFSVSQVNAAYKFTKESGVSNMADKSGLSTVINTPEFYIGNFLTILFSFLGVIFLVLTIYAGIKWMTAQGNTNQIDQAKDTLTRSIIGLVISIAAYGITYFILTMFNKQIL